MRYSKAMLDMPLLQDLKKMLLLEAFSVFFFMPRSKKIYPMCPCTLWSLEAFFKLSV